MSSTRSTIVLVHGAWHGAWCWASVIRELSMRGRGALAFDMLGHGAEALLPASFQARPFDPQAFATEPSPLAEVSVQAAASRLVEQIKTIHPQAPVTLVAHSMSGPVASAAAELAPHLVGALVYVAALMPPPGRTAASFGMSEANASSLVRGLVVADPEVVRTLRIDPRNPDPDYRRAMREAFYADVPVPIAEGAMRFLTCDDPSAVVSGIARLTERRFGAIPRRYVVCERDMAIRPAVQLEMIQAVDDAFTAAATQVHRLACSHSPFLSMPDRLAEIIVAAAAPATET